LNGKNEKNIGNPSVGEVEMKISNPCVEKLGDEDLKSLSREI